MLRVCVLINGHVVVLQLAEGEFKVWYDTLALFAYGTFSDYKGASPPPPTPAVHGALTPLAPRAHRFTTCSRAPELW